MNITRQRITAVIPTKNRPLDLPHAVTSILSQSRIPDELVIIDQSDDSQSKGAIDSVWLEHSLIKLIYIHDTTITGLVDAKRYALSYATGDIVCFLEDDVVLENDYIEQIEKGFIGEPKMVGCCGVITNPPSYPRGYKFFFHVFHRGIFRDKRVGNFDKCVGSNNALIISDKLSGGVSAWKKEVFLQVKFDVENDFFMLEDMEFSTRVNEKYPSQLYINSNARLAHNCSPVNRQILGPRQTRKVTEFILYYKKRKFYPWAHLSIVWLLIGALFEAIFQSAMNKSMLPVLGYFKGIRIGISKKLVNI